MEINDLFFGHLNDLAIRAANTGCAASRFLSPAEAAGAAARFANGREASLIFDGGFKNAERVRAVFLNPEWGEYVREEWLCALQIRRREQDTISHRDILGALMALGVERGVVGDIIADAPVAALVCLPEMSGHIAQNLTKIGRVGVTVSPVPLNGLPVKSESLAEKTDTVASPRLDAMLSAAFDLSRGDAAKLIAAGYVSLNHIVCLQPAKEAAEGAMLSVRGKGRAKVLEVGGLSKKGRIFVRIGTYAR